MIGGGAVGLDVVEYFAPRGAETTIVEMLPTIGSGLDPVTKVDVFSLMEKYRVRQMPRTKLKSVQADSFLVETPKGEENIPFDYGFICLGMTSKTPVLPDIQTAFQDNSELEIVNIGDSVKARRIIDGTSEGRNILYVLEKRGYL